MKRFSKILIVFAAFLLSRVLLFAQDQPKIDSLFTVLRTAPQDTNKVILLYDLSREFFNSDIDRAETYSNRALFLAERLGYKKGMAMAYNNLGIISYYKAIYNVALSYQDRSLQIMEEIGDKKGMAGSHNNKGAVYTEQGNYTDAINEYMNSLKILEEINDAEGVGKSYNNVGLVYYLQGNYNQAKNYYEKALEILNKFKSQVVIADIYNNLGIISYEEAKYDEATEYHLKSLKIREESRSLRGVASSFTNLGDVYAAREAFSKALEYQHKALAIQEELDDKKGMLSSLNGISTVFSLTGKMPEALDYMERVSEISAEIGAKKERMDACNHLSDMYYRIGNYKKALDYKNIYTQMKDTLYSEQTTEFASNMEAKLENEKKSKEIALLQQQNQIQELELGRNRTLIISFTIGLILALISVIVYARTNREKRKALQLLQRQNESIKRQKEEKEVLLKEIHHRVKNNLQVINSLIRLQCAYTEDQEALELFDECQNRIISMALIHEKMYEAHDLSNINIQEYVEQLAQNLIRSYRLNQSISLDLNIEIESLSLDTLVPLGLLLNEMISNSLKHAFKERESGRISIKLRRMQSGMFELEIGDNGIGLAENFSFKSAHTLGLELIVTLTSQLEGKIQRLNQPGSFFKITFKGLEKHRPDIEKAIVGEDILEA